MPHPHHTAPSAKPRILAVANPDKEPCGDGRPAWPVCSTVQVRRGCTGCASQLNDSLDPTPPTAGSHKWGPRKRPPATAADRAAKLYLCATKVYRQNCQPTVLTQQAGGHSGVAAYSSAGVPQHRHWENSEQLLPACRQQPRPISSYLGCALQSQVGIC